MKRDLIDSSDLTTKDDVIDVRSPSEYKLDHIPGAINLPVLNDSERQLVGWTYKNESAFKAKKIGASLVAKNIAQYIDTTLAQKPENWSPVIYCWRGGKRSGSMSLIFRNIGWRARQLSGGYKTFRRQVITDISTLAPAFNYIVICGLTGTAKTDLIEAIRNEGGQTLNLEAIANHRGSLLGYDPHSAQPSQKKFETQIWHQLKQFNVTQPVFVESESKKIGDLRLPEALIDTVRKGTCINIQVNLIARTKYLKETYDHLVQNPSSLTNQLEKLRSRHGNRIIDCWLELISSNKWDDLIQDLLGTHYDPSYTKSMNTNFKNMSQAKGYSIDTILPDTVLALAKKILSDYSIN